ncbi:hypothetical protein BKA61DRAFT_557960 [Leptodontidium sp. MPI-SDFR-AT-0119]|nr:hypothetical protein BKA61DRAFT_557960 [Leptodontidium sp. MPI-SDFR-AT-0119]
MNSRILGRAFRCSECAVRIPGRGISIQQRTFSSSSIRQKHGAVPAFTEVSSPELQDLLTKLRERLFLPAHLSKGQQDLIFKPKYEKSLEVEPVTAIIAGEEFRLKHINIVKDVPGTTKSLRRALKLMKEKRDWDNLPNLLRGLRTVGFRFGRIRPETLVRKAGSAGRQDVILECLRRADETGLTLTDPLFVVQVFFWIQQKAMASNWDAEETKKALHWAEMVKEMMEDPKHHAPEGSKSVAQLHEVNGILLELAAVRAVKQQGGKDGEGKVEKYALELLASPRDFEPREEASSGQNYWLSTNTPGLHGMKLAQTVLGPTSELSIGLKGMCEALEPLLSASRDELFEHSKLHSKEDQYSGVRIFDELLGPNASYERGMYVGAA